MVFFGYLENTQSNSIMYENNVLNYFLKNVKIKSDLFLNSINYKIFSRMVGVLMICLG